MRAKIFSELVGEVLGPRNGLHELLKGSPLDEYITGVLSPLQQGSRGSDEVVELAETDDDPTSEDSPESQEIYDPGSFSPALDPRARPHTFGISFVVHGDGPAVPLGLCITWARYARVKGGDSGWVREPSGFADRSFSVSPGPDTVLFLDRAARPCSEGEADLRVTLRVRALAPGIHRVAVFVGNAFRIPSESRAGPESHVFQPQIRVVVGPGFRVGPFRDGLQRADKGVEEFLYRGKPTMAHGHMCAAVWKGLDLQPRYDSIAEPGPESWLDGALLDATERGVFGSPDVRSEFVPSLPVLGPELLLDDNDRRLPALYAEQLSECWERDELRKLLSPITGAYSEWLTGQERLADNLPDEERSTARGLLAAGREVNSRIDDGIRMLESDPDARLAFCFANRAMAQTAHWAGRSSFRWRPFQMAFMLSALRSTLDPSNGDRRLCDLLWVPTGGGKTEAYLGLAAVLMAYRRRRAVTGQSSERTGGGVSILTRYTLRLLTIQQFRRVSTLVTACEYLRVAGLRTGGPAGWRPKACPMREELIWGSMRFSVGLWVGGEVTPNRLGPSGTRGDVPGALEILCGADGPGEPAQVVECPSCRSILSIPKEGLPRDHSYKLHLGIGLNSGSVALLRATLGAGTGLSTKNVQVTGVTIVPHPFPTFSTLGFSIRAKKNLTPHLLDIWWDGVSKALTQAGCSHSLVPARASRPGYVILSYLKMTERPQPYDFDVYCPNPDCELNHDVLWLEGAPIDSGWLDLDRGEHGRGFPGAGDTKTLAGAGFAEASLDDRKVRLPDGLHLKMVPKPFWNVQRGRPPELTLPYISTRIPIPVLTVDEQVYHRVPTMIVATVDKFARLPYEPRSGSLFGNVDRHHARFGYYRQGAAPHAAGGGENPPGADPHTPIDVPVPSFDPPGLIIQDELHLIEGPLGSMVGIYETAVEELASHDGRGPKYVAATATIHEAGDQVQSIFDRKVCVFPPMGTDPSDRFFVREPRVDPLDETAPGRLYVGICAPGLGPLTPLVRICSRLLQSVYTMRTDPDVDPFWTLVGYFNSIRELGGARALYRQDIPNRLHGLPAHQARGLPEERCFELSSRTESASLPSVLGALEAEYSGDPARPGALDALFTTSMFGTGVDVQRLSLMFVGGQPKSTSSYVQSTGRVGRRSGALVVTFYRATRPRDLSHYELFCGYHSALHRHVEPVTVSPFSSGALSRAAGPVMLGILRNRHGPNLFIPRTSATAISGATGRPEVRGVPDAIASRSQVPPLTRRPDREDVENFAKSELDRWNKLALACRDLEYVEYYATDHSVVLGDLPHEHAGRTVVFHNAPQSLREVEETTGFETED
jgi:hypothetical protein